MAGKDYDQERLPEYLKWFIGYIEDYGFQPNWRETALHFKIHPTNIGLWNRHAQARGLIQLAPGKHERSVLLNHVRFQAELRTEETPFEWPPELLELSQGIESVDQSARRKQSTRGENLNALHAFVVNYVEQYGFQPTWAEIGIGLGIAKPTARAWGTQLVERGVLLSPPWMKERCLGLTTVRFRAIPTDEVKSWPEEFLTYYDQRRAAKVGGGK